MRDPRINFSDNAQPPWLDLDALHEAIRDAGFLEQPRKVSHAARYVYPGCHGCGSTNIRLLTDNHDQPVEHGNGQVLAECGECTAGWAIVPVDPPVHVIVPTGWEMADAASLAHEAIRRLELVTGPRIEFGPLTERELALYERIETLQERAVEAENALAWAEQPSDSDEDPDDQRRFVLIEQQVPGVNVGPNERVVQIEWADDHRHVCSLWFPADDLGWRFYLPTPWPGWSDERYAMWEDAAQAAVDSIRAWPTLTPWYRPDAETDTETDG